MDTRIIPKAPKSLEERKVYRTEAAVGAEAEIIGAGFDLLEGHEFIAASVIVNERRPTVPFR